MNWHTLTQALLAQTGGGGPGGMFGGMMLPLLLMFGVFYFLLIRPESKRRKQHQELLNVLKKDDEVVTASGMYGRIINLEDRVVTLEISDKVKIKMLRDRIAGRWNPSAPSPKK